MQRAGCRRHGMGLEERGNLGRTLGRAEGAESAHDRGNALEGAELAGQRVPMGLHECPRGRAVAAAQERGDERGHVLRAHLVGERERERALHQRGRLEGGEGVEEPVVLVGRARRGAHPRQVLVVECGVAAGGRHLQHGCHDGRRQRRGVCEVAAGQGARARLQRRVAGHAAEQAQQGAPAAEHVVAIAGARLEAHGRECGCERGANPRIERCPLRRIRDRAPHVAGARHQIVEHRRRLVGGERGREIQVGADIVPPRAHHAPLIAEQADALGRGERRGARGQRLDGRRLVLGEVVAARIGVHERRAAARRIEGLGGLGHDLTGGGAAAGLHAHRQRPGLGRGGGGRGLAWRAHEALLPHRDPRLARHARRAHRQHRRAGLIHEAAHDAVHRLLGDARDFLPEVLTGGVARRIAPEVRRHGLLELRRADVGLDHVEHAGGLLVGDRIEYLVDLGGCGDGRADRAGRAQRVEAECRLSLLRGVELHAPLGLPGGERLVGGPRGEPLVQPDIVPPLHRDQVAEPLVREFVRDHRRHRLAHANRGRGFVDEQHALAEGDGARVLHRAGGEVGHADDVELAERIPDAEVVVEELHLMFRGGHGEGGEGFLVGRGAHADGDAVAGALAAYEVADQQGHQIGGHLLRGGEGDGVLTRFRAGRVRYGRAVRDGRIDRVDHQRDVERGFLGRLVEAGERAARVGGLHLTDRVVAPVRLAQVEPAQLVVQDAGVGDADRGRSGGQRLRGQEREGHRLGLGVRRHVGDMRDVRGLDQHLAKSEFSRMQGDGRGRLLDAHLDLGTSAERGVREVGRKPQPVVLGGHAGRQTLRGGWSGNECEDDGKGDAHASTVADAGVPASDPDGVTGTNAVTAKRLRPRAAGTGAHGRRRVGSASTSARSPSPRYTRARRTFPSASWKNAAPGVA